jgi:hypothetical protein
MRRVCTVITIVLAFGVLTSSAQTIRHGVHDGGAVSRRRTNRYNRADHRRSHVKSSYRWPVQAHSGHAARHVDYRRFRFWIFALDQIPLALSGHPAVARQCPLLGAKRTSRFQGAMSAFDPKRT